MLGILTVVVANFTVSLPPTPPQACYGIVKVPFGNWLCRTCVLGISPQCLLCPKKGGAMKATRAGTKWAHVSCALWIPEVRFNQASSLCTGPQVTLPSHHHPPLQLQVSIACPERMEPITKVSHIPPSRWSLICSLCKLKTGACIQVSPLALLILSLVFCKHHHLVLLF